MFSCFSVFSIYIECYLSYKIKSNLNNSESYTHSCHNYKLFHLTLENKKTTYTHSDRGNNFLEIKNMHLTERYSLIWDLGTVCLYNIIKMQSNLDGILRK